jgi:hypothetical protein
MKELCARILVICFFVIGIALLVYPSLSPQAAPPPIPTDPTWTDTAWAFSKFALSALPGVLVLALGIALISAPFLIFFHHRAKLRIREIEATQLIPRGLERLSFNAGSRNLTLRNYDNMRSPLLEDTRPPLPDVVDMVQMLDTWQPSPSSILLGLGAGGAPLTAPVKGLCHVALGGPTGAGKSNLLRLLLSQLLAADAHVALADPHYADVDVESGDDWRPIAARLAMAPASTPHDIRHLLGYFTHELEHRLSLRKGGEHPGGPLFLAIDELPAIVAAVKEAPDAIARLLREGRKVNILLITSAQDWLVKTIGNNSGVREAFRTAYYMGGDQQTGRILLDLQGRVDDGSLGAGVAYLRSAATPQAQLVRVPLASNEAVYTLLGQTKPARSQIEIATEPDYSASQPLKTLDPVEARIIDLFRQGHDIAEIVRTIDPDAKVGARYQKRSAEVQAVLRALVQEQH